MWLNILLVLIGLFTFLYYRVTKKFGFFKSHGVVESPGYFPFGSSTSAKVITGRRSFFDLITDFYTDFGKEKMVGYYFFTQPTLVINDLELVKQICIKDFDYFVDRRSIELDHSNEVNKIMSRSMLDLKGDLWKTVRSYMSPAFTSGRLRTMTPFFQKVSIAG
jgi:cytochrome P450